ncbi:hypothetical protein A4V12_17155 [Streptomyces noursei]|nr:hypothetical protein A4V12_17155 [Streptomyces noursei]
MRTQDPAAAQLGKIRQADTGKAGELTDESWAVIEPLLAPPRMGRPVRDRRQVLNGDLPYELCVLVALRDALRRREIWVVGASRWRNPEDDLPAGFEDNRDVHYAALRRPL